MTEVNKFLGITIVKETRQERQQRVEVLSRASNELANGLPNGLPDADRFIWDERKRLSHRIEFLDGSICHFGLRRWQLIITILKQV
ncbi:MAG: hypothetical protein Q7R97_00455 [Candidatus Daviesbacteria bacterium]|nr:hypothetical protein [Candidatus Daviesbacteria bacterium]